jgi:DNA mismatch repair protein MSH6
MIEEWLTAPLLQVTAITERQDAVQDLMKLTDITSALRLKSKGSDAGGSPRLSSLPDLERLLSRVHSLGSLHRVTDHPESRAVMYEEPKYNRNKIMAFASVLNGFKQARRIVDLFSDSLGSIESPLLRRILTIKGDSSEKGTASFPDLAADLKHFDSIFDAKKAKETGSIEPRRGMDEGRLRAMHSTAMHSTDSAIPRELFISFR